MLQLLEAWVRLTNEASAAAAAGSGAGGLSGAGVSAASERQFHAYLAMLGSQGVLSSDASTERFFRIMMELCVQSCAATARPHPAPVAVDAPAGPGGAVPVPTPRTRLQYTGIDALARLVLVLVKVAEGAAAKIALFSKLLAIFARCLLRDADAHGAGSTPETALAGLPAADAAGAGGAPRFDQRPYLRLFASLLRDMHHAPPPAPPPGADEASVAAVAAATADASAFNSQVLAALANVLHAVRPERVPGFAFAWLELAAHRLLLPPLLAVPGQRGWPLAHRLVLDLFRFLYPALRRAEMNAAVKLLYRGGLRLLLVLHHDAPEFLADFAAPLLEVLPPSCIQLRNLLLSAAPRAVRLPDPFAASAAVEAVPECAVLPRVLGSPGDAVPLPPASRAELDALLRSVSVASARPAGSLAAPTGAAGVAALAASPLGGALRQCLLASREEELFTLSRFSGPAMQALALHIVDVVCARLAEDAAAIAAASGAPAPLRGTVPVPALVAAASSSPATDVINFLLGEAGAEARYALLNALVNHLRYPSAHTLFFSTLLLRGVFMGGASTGAAGTGAASASASALPGGVTEVIREQLTRVMLERVIVHRPHPWGLLVTFIALIRSPAYAFWGHAFTRLSPEVEKLFENVARSCGGPASAGAAGGGGAAPAVAAAE